MKKSQSTTQYNNEYPIGKKISKEVMQDFKQVFQTDPKIKYQDSDEDNQQEFLDRVQTMISTDRNKIITQSQKQLHAMIEELQQKCAYLGQMNQFLVKKMEQNKESQKNQPISPRWTVPITPRDQTSFVEEISEIQNQFSQLEELLASYRQQLIQYQQNVNKEKNKYQIQISALRQEIQGLEQEIYTLQKSAAEQKIIKNKLIKKNSELVIEVQALQTENQELYQENKRKQQSFFSSKISKNDYSINGDECMAEMQKIIDQLANQLEYQRNMRERVSNQMKRLSIQLKRQQKKIQKKNNQIYALEKDLINLKKQIVHQCSIFQDKRQIELVRPMQRQGSTNFQYKNTVKQKNMVESFSSNRRLSGFLESVMRRQGNQANIQQLGIRFKKIQDQDESECGVSSKKQRTNIKNYNNAYDLEKNEEKGIKSNERYGKKRKLTFDLGQSYEKQMKINTIPQISEEFYRMGLQKFLTEYQFPQQTILVACKKIINLFNEIQEKQETRVMFCLQNLQVSHFSVNDPDSLRLRLIQVAPKKVILNSRSQFFLSTLYLVETILEGKQFYDLNPHLQRIVQELKQAPVRKQKFTFLNLALQETMGKMMKSSGSKNQKLGIPCLQK